MLIINSAFDKYPLALAFQTLGLHLYGDQWTGNEIRGRRVEDPTSILEARAPLEIRVEELCLLINEANRRQKEVVGGEAIIEINREIDQLDEERNQLAKQLFDIGEPGSGALDDHGEWKRFVETEGQLLKGLGSGEITVIGSHGTVVKKELWRDLSEEFGCDWVRSLIFFPKIESSNLMQSGHIKEDEIVLWLDTVLPINPSNIEKLTVERRARIRFKELVPKYDGSELRDDYLEQMQAEFPKLSERAFIRIWNELATDKMKKAGPRARK
ncbi:MAG: hypothetical protein V7727_16560 [Sneathiella sp.]